MHGRLPPDDETTAELIARLREDAKGFAQAEIRLYRTIATAKIRVAKTVGIFGVAAAMLAGSAITALLVGLILTLATLTGPGIATLIVVVGALIVAGILGWVAADAAAKGFGGGAKK